MTLYKPQFYQQSKSTIHMIVRPHDPHQSAQSGFQQILQKMTIVNGGASINTYHKCFWPRTSKHDAWVSFSALSTRKLGELNKRGCYFAFQMLNHLVVLERGSCGTEVEPSHTTLLTVVSPREIELLGAGLAATDNRRHL